MGKGDACFGFAGIVLRR